MKNLMSPAALAAAGALLFVGAACSDLSDVDLLTIEGTAEIAG